MTQNQPQDNLIQNEVPPSNDRPIPRWLKITYWSLPLWGIFTFFLYWNGSKGWLDRGHWEQLQKAANTIYPFNAQSVDSIDRETASKDG